MTPKDLFDEIQHIPGGEPYKMGDTLLFSGPTGCQKFVAISGGPGKYWFRNITTAARKRLLSAEAVMTILRMEEGTFYFSSYELP